MITVHGYGVWHKWDIPIHVTDQLWLAHQAREDLVTTTLDHDARMRRIWSAHPQVEAAQQQITELQEQLANLEQKDQDATRLRALLRQARKDRRAGIAAARQDETFQTAVRAAVTDLHDRRSQLRRQYCTQGVVGRDRQVARLYHTTWYLVLTNHETAEKRVAATRATGGKAEMRHHRFDGTGTIAVMLPRPSGAPARTPLVVADPFGKYRNVFALDWCDPERWAMLTRAEQRLRGRLTARMRVGYADDQVSPTFADIPVQAHRFLPADADITGAQLTVSRRGKRLVASLCVTAKNLPDPPPSTLGGPIVVLHWGWRESDQGVKVAHWASTTPLIIPPELKRVMVSHDDGLTGAVVTPCKTMRGLELVEQFRSRIDLGFNEAKTLLVEWLRDHSAADPTSKDDQLLVADDVARWRNPERLARLANAWADDPPTDGETVAMRLWRWRCQHVHDSTLAANTRAKALNRRDDAYRNVAALLARETSTVAVDDMSFARLAKTDDAAMPADAARRSSRRRAHAAPGALRAAITTACAREGTEVKLLDSAWTTRTCFDCGHINPADGRWSKPQARCDGCGKTYDQDVNAVQHLLRTAIRT